MQHDELMSLKETGQKGDFLLPYVVNKTVMPDYYTTFPMHWHDEMEIVFVEEGEFIECVDFEDYHLKKGDIALVNPSVLHSFRQFENKRTVFRSIIFNMNLLTGNSTDACSIKYFVPFTENGYISPVVISPDNPSYPAILDRVKNMITVYGEKGDCFEIRLKTEVYGLFYILFKDVFVNEYGDSTIRDITTRNIKVIIDYINENYMNNITIDELAETVNLSKHYFMRFFKKYMGMTCIEYINDYRLNIASNMLLTTRVQITEVAASIGIMNLSYFNRIFKKKFHMTPKEYRYSISNR